MAKNPFVGTWRLESCEFRSVDGHVTHPLGLDAIGYILYSEDGYMSVTLMPANRTRFADGDVSGGTDEEKIASAETYVAYCGTYEIQGKTVVHHIEASFFPNWIGTDQVRSFELDGDRLTLSTPPYLAGGQQQVSLLIWQRIGTP